MSSSDQSDDGIYQSDEDNKVTSLLHMRNSSSEETLNKNQFRRDSGFSSVDSHSEDCQLPVPKPRLLRKPPPRLRKLQKQANEDELRWQGTGTPLSGRIGNGRVGRKPTQDGGKDKTDIPEVALEYDGVESERTGREDLEMVTSAQMFVSETDVQGLISDSVKARLKELTLHGRHLIYLSTSLMKEWKISPSVPSNVLFDVCAFSNTQPVFVLTFCKGAKQGSVHRYNVDITRYLVSKTRKSISNFTAVNGVMDERDCQSGEMFRCEMDKIQSQAMCRFVPKWLWMNSTRCDKLVQIFMRIGLKHGQEWINISKSFLNEKMKGMQDSLPKEVHITISPEINNHEGEGRPVLSSASKQTTMTEINDHVLRSEKNDKPELNTTKPIKPSQMTETVLPVPSKEVIEVDFGASSWHTTDLGSNSSLFESRCVSSNMQTTGDDALSPTRHMTSWQRKIRNRRPRTPSKEEKRLYETSKDLKTRLLKVFKHVEKEFDKHIRVVAKPKWLCNHDWRRVQSDNSNGLSTCRGQSPNVKVEGQKPDWYKKTRHRRVQSCGTPETFTDILSQYDFHSVGQP